MHYALQLARRGRSSVLLCDRAALDAAPPLLPQDVTSGDVALQDVNIKCGLPWQAPGTHA
jgi:hypothetical protein